MTTVGATEKSAEIPQICTKSQESSDNTTEGRDEWLISIENHVEDATEKPQIEKVPSLMRVIESNKGCYDPQVVSIGPYHHGKPELKAFEKLKIPIALKFWHACEKKVPIKQIYEAVAREGKSALECYAYEKDSTGFDDYKLFNRMMFLDACFVLHFLSTFLEDKEQNEVDQRLVTDLKGEEQNEVTEIVVKSLYSVLRDLLLLENQIPFLVLEVLLEFRFERETDQTSCIQKFLDRYILMPAEENSCTNDVKKFLAQMKECCTKSGQEMTKWKLDLDSSPPHLLHLVREQLISPFMHESQNKNTFVKRQSYRSLTELKSTGIHFKPSQTGNLTDVEFKSRLIYSTLTLPSIVIDDRTKSLFLNLVAYEKCPHGPSDLHITSYICLMDSLIDHPDDVKELRKKTILVNYLGSDEQLAKLFVEISQDLIPHPHAYANVMYQIQNHCQKKLPAWVQSCMVEEWMHKYFSSPWAFLAVLGAIIALLLTAVQTYFTIFPRKT
ncbi:unnamed protein product [Fraxinus pennsylvanica]|uniref:Uncharacterized protein n=1 Tax=Fraxinus pennsylvanica TaxID=56036 RepID=A0AAD2E6X0_9LAMI|nr:unnamed protein product [Fraxinus pennsylvanica]